MVLLGLQDSLRELSVALQRAIHAVGSALQNQPGSGDWVLVADGYNPLPASLRGVVELSPYRTIEEGPPDTPGPLLKWLARDHLLTGNPSFFELRATEAFEAGFWIKAALDTGTPYRPDKDRVSFEAKHWLVFSRRGSPFHTRLTSSSCLAVLLHQEEGAVVESFESLCELCICCIGAQVAVPPLRKRISQQ